MIKENIVIMNVMQYPDKNTGEIKSRLEFFFSSPNKKQISKNFKGKALLTIFYNNSKPFDCIEDKMLECEIEANFKVVANVKNPLHSSAIIESIVYKGNVINLL